MLFVFCLIVIKRIRFFVSEKKSKKIRHDLSKLVGDCLEKKRTLNSIKLVCSQYILLEVLEGYNLRFSGDDWKQLNSLLSQRFLLPKARRWVKSWFWLKRNFAARVFALAPLSKDESHIVQLTQDRSFLVRSVASVAAVKLESKRGVLNILHNMHQELGYAHVYYSDILSQGSNQVFNWVAEVAAEHKALHLVCLEVLAGKTAPVATPFLNEDFQAKNAKIRQAALKVAIRNPQKGNEKIFSSCLEDPDEEIRILGSMGLGNYPVKEGYAALQKGASDSSWKVRLECAKSLKKLGKIHLLKDPEMVQYVLEFV